MSHPILSLKLLAAAALAICIIPHSIAAKSRQGSASKAAKSITVFAAGDIAQCKDRPALESLAAQTAGLISTGLRMDSKALVLTLGDNTYPVGMPEEFNKCYAPTWGAFKEQTLPSPGNHDYGVPLALGYFGYFGDQAGPDRRGYYSKNAGSWHIVSLNSNLKDEQLQAQINWLKEDLQSNKHSCTLAYWHHPLFSSGGHGNNPDMQAIWKILQEAKAELVLVGHDHDYERFAPQDADGKRNDKNGIRSFVVGTGGAKLTSFLLTKPNSEVRDNSTNGVLKLTLRDKAYDWEFLGLPGSTFTDKGTDKCHP